jgi:2-polyprenyl-6-methoxyphenol hydroxylase-like FAD-dependent oxidoreductase
MLGRHGVHVLIVDRAEFPRDKICGCCLHPKSWEILERIGAADMVHAAPQRKISGVHLASWQGRSTHTLVSSRLVPQLAAIPRGTLDELLLLNAQASGGESLLGTRVIAVKPVHPLEVLTHGPGGSASLFARYVVGADGRNSIVARLMKSRPTEQRNRSPRFGVQWFAKAQATLRDEILLGLLPYGYFGVVNVDQDRANVAMVVDPRRTPVDYRLIPYSVGEIIRSSPALRHLIDDLTPVSHVLTASPINPRTVRSRHVRIFLAGDAHHTVEPFTGEGITFALYSGVEVARQILSMERRKRVRSIRSRTDFWVNHVYSPLLRHPALSNASLTLVASSSRLLALALRTVLG